MPIAYCGLDKTKKQPASSNKQSTIEINQAIKMNLQFIIYEKILPKLKINLIFIHITYIIIKTVLFIINKN